jgi:cytochrome c553
MKFKFLIAAFSVALMATNSTVMAADAAAGEAMATAFGCGGCHNADGNSVIPGTPKLAGQHGQYIVKQLNDFKSMKRASDVMMGMASMVASDEDAANIGAFYASQKATVDAADDSKVALGRDIYRGGNSVTKVPACMGCHSPNGSGNPTAKYPSLAGQQASYTITQLKAFREGTRANDANSMMRNVAAHMSNAEIEAVSNYIASMK